jgi:hypothetical protein
MRRSSSTDEGRKLGRGRACDPVRLSVDMGQANLGGMADEEEGELHHCPGAYQRAHCLSAVERRRNKNAADAMSARLLDQAQRLSLRHVAGVEHHVGCRHEIEDLR